MDRWIIFFVVATLCLSACKNELKQSENEQNATKELTQSTLVTTKE